MAKKMVQKMTALALVVLFFLSGMFSWENAAATEPEKTSVSTQTTARQSYRTYLAQYPNAGYCGETIQIPAAVTSGGENISAEENFEGKDVPVLLTEAEGYAEWMVEVPQTGLWTIEVEYFPLEGTGGVYQREVLIDGLLPFEEASPVKFSRVYRDAAPIEHYEGKNDIWPQQEEVLRWQSAYVQDAKGYFGDRLAFYLEAGVHTITFVSIAEPMAISNLTLASVQEEIPDYAAVQQEYQAKGYSPVKGVLSDGILIVQAEEAYEKSDQSLHPNADVSSPANQPYDYRYQKINVVGGALWQNPGQWVSWKIDVPESGLYEIGFRARQNYLRDIAVERSIYIDGKLPFLEAGQVAFSYNGKWTVSTAGEKEPYLFYLEKGERIITMNVTCGRLADSLMLAQESLKALNEANWILLTVIGNTPDLNRDYNLDKYCPEVIEIFKKQSKQLSSIAAEWMAMTGSQDANVAQIDKIVFMLDQMVEDPDEIPGLYLTFKDDVSNFANLITNATMRPLALDYLFIAEQGAELPRANVGFFTSLKFGFLKFLMSFFTDYNNLSEASGTNSDKEPVTVWIGNSLAGGRDQAVQLNNLANQMFTAETGIPINLEIVAPATILTATVSGFGPDVALQVPGSEATQYAMRNAVTDLSKLESFDEVKSRFHPEDFVSATYQGGIYMLPETDSFPVMFYRRDILTQLGIDIEQIKTWEDLIVVMATLQRQNMNVGMAPTLYYTFLYQMGGTVYKNGNTASNLDSKTALDAFHYYMSFYTNYGLPLVYNFSQRFRTGEMPISIEEYTQYNLLRLAAPEIEGQWGIAPIPGMRREDGSIDNTAQLTSSGCVLMSAAKNPEDAWAFMKWYTQADIQHEFGSRLESVMGVGARYNTANRDAFARLPWQTAEKEALSEQMKHLQGIPEVPGGYLSARSVTFAINTTYNTRMDARRTLLSYVERINQEIAIKRKEFGLPVE